MNYVHPEYLIEAGELATLLNDENVRIFDTSVLLHRSSNAYTAESGRAHYLKEHIPGAGFIDLLDDWSDAASPFNNTLLAPVALAKAIGDTGISADHKVVLYSSGHIMWATRAWWCLHYAGHKNIMVLNGNLSAWRHAGAPLSAGTEHYPATTFNAPPNLNAIVSTQEVEDAIEHQVCVVNALSPELYAGTGDFYYHRRGHIPSSTLVYFDALLENEYFRSPQQLLEALSTANLLQEERVITYCGGGIAATVDAFACKLMGQHNVSVYDGSMSEWTASDERPLTLGDQP